MAATHANAASPRYAALALQTRCDAVNQDGDAAAARARMQAAIARVSAQIGAAKSFLMGFNGHDLKLVCLPEYFMTGFPLGETRAQWQAKAAVAMNGPEIEAIGAVAQRHRLHLCANLYETDGAFPDLYFQANLVFGPNGDVILRYRRMISLYAPTPFDVWDRYIDTYGKDAIFPVAPTEIGVLGAIASEEILYPEIARMIALKGAEIMLHPTSEVSAPGLTPKDIAKRARAYENIAYVVSANSAGIVGTPVPEASTDGLSKIVDWSGKVLAEAAGGETMNAHAAIDLDGLRDARRRTGMSNTLSRLPLAAFAGSYADIIRVTPNAMADGRMLDRAEVIARQRAVIERMVRDGVIR